MDIPEGIQLDFSLEGLSDLCSPELKDMLFNKLNKHVVSKLMVL